MPQVAGKIHTKNIIINSRAAYLPRVVASQELCREKFDISKANKTKKVMLGKNYEKLNYHILDSNCYRLGIAPHNNSVSKCEHDQRRVREII